MGNITEYDEWDATAMAAHIAAGDVSSAELVEEAIRRAEAVNPQLNAIIHQLYEDARAAAKRDHSQSLFKGTPFVIKDLVSAYGGAPLRNGSRFTENYIPNRDSILIERYKAAGLIPIGKTSTPEMGLTPYTEPALFGPTNNPWDLTRSSGGSSGGTGAIVAARVVPLGHGGDGGGSIRIPASCCGLFGLKPTSGRTPNSLEYESWHGFVAEHVLTLSVRDSAAVLDATCGTDPAAPAAPQPPHQPYIDAVKTRPQTLRIAYSSQPLMGEHVDPVCVAAMNSAVELCRDLGHELIEAAPPIDRVPFSKAFLILLCGELHADIQKMAKVMGKKPRAADFEPTTWGLYLLGSQFTAGDFAAAVHTLQANARQVARFFDQVDMFITPTLATPPIKTGALQVKGAERMAMSLIGPLNAGGLLRAVADIDRLAAQTYAYIPYTPVFNVTKQPAMSMPLYWSDDGLPIGVHFVGRYGDEATMFQLAGQLEAARPWVQRRPPVSAAG